MEIEKISDFGVGDIVQPYYYTVGRRYLEGMRKVIEVHTRICCGHHTISLSGNESEFVRTNQCAGGWKPIVRHLSKRIAVWVIRDEI
jgi:hypothetical protein